LDEPTNDLDLQTLRVLENFLMDFEGCLLIVSHDRYFMDRLVNHLFVFEGKGLFRDFPGNYAQYRLSLKEAEKPTGLAVQKPQTQSENEWQTRQISEKKKRSYKEQREFDLLEKDMESLSQEKTAITLKLNSGALPFDELQRLSVRIVEVARLLDEKEIRWLELSQ
jgi:ATP-binding cassette subfamily F protein uup